MRRKATISLALLVALATTLGVLNALFPFPEINATPRFARVVVDKDGVPLRAFADTDGVWRYPISLNDVSPNYIEALLTYEDRWFWYHPGVNPFALLRATWQNLVNGDVISGGSTLSMQVARLIDPNERSLTGKLKQMLRALQLEWRYDKEQILTLYLNRAPFGGPLQGIEAASFTYLGKSATMLSDAEAALLVVLPQAPSRNRPDRYPQRAQQQRNKIIKRLARLDVWTQQRARDALQEPLWAQFYAQPMIAPLLSRRLAQRDTSLPLHRSTIASELQQGIADVVKNRVQAMPPGTSIAILVVENHSLAVRAYVGSADFRDHSRFGHVDMVQAVRSPGSTLKPFLYGMALDAGLIHSQSLLVDAPSDFGDYRPENFTTSYSGPVSVGDALQRSLNIPAIQVLDRLGSHRLLSQLRHAGMQIQLPNGARSNLALGLGGAGTTLETLVGAFTALANNGLAGKLRFAESDPFSQRRLLSAGSAWIVREILFETRRPDQPARHLLNDTKSPLAWKTGTSYGFRDSWAIGVQKNHTVGVWVGRPDGTPVPGYYGAIAAAPLLFTIADHLPPIKPPRNARYPIGYRRNKPPTVRQVDICWPLGQQANATPAAHCHKRKHAYVLNDNVPRTFHDGDLSDWGVNPAKLWINPLTGKRVDASCNVDERQAREIALWPKAVEPWIELRYRRTRQIPPYDPACSKPPDTISGQLRIAGLRDGSVIKPLSGSRQRPQFPLQALGGQGQHYWFINGELHYILPEHAIQKHTFAKAGTYTVTVVDERGKSDEAAITIILN